jgi:hypothetical protein
MRLRTSPQLMAAVKAGTRLPSARLSWATPRWVPPAIFWKAPPA